MEKIFIFFLMIILLGCTTIQTEAIYVDSQDIETIEKPLSEVDHIVLENLSFWIGIVMSSIAWYYYDLITDLTE